jgi:hypothetical protein
MSNCYKINVAGLLMTGTYKKILFILTILVLFSGGLTAQQMHKIPMRVLNLYKLIGDTTNNYLDTVRNFEISDFITYKEYKVYLASMKKDSSTSFYKSQLPDTNIAFKKEVYEKYINSSEYDNYPVIGISWDNAMNYCKWKTLKENKDSIKVYYRLPDCSEWLSAMDFMSNQKIKNDFNQNYSDWLMGSRDETTFIYNRKKYNYFPYDYCYIHRKDDSPALKRKFVIGDSYLYQLGRLKDYANFSYHSYNGYRQVAFRIVKKNRMLSEYNHNNNGVFKYWGLEK